MPERRAGHDIANAYGRHPGPGGMAVVGRPHPDWGEEVVAVVVAKAGEQVSERELECLASIVRLKRPKLYLFVDELPKKQYRQGAENRATRAVDRERQAIPP